MRNCNGPRLLLTFCTLLAWSRCGLWAEQRIGVESSRIPMRDGKELAADLYRPHEDGRYPTILIMTPYSRVPMRQRLPDQERQIFDPERYAYVVVDWRGKFGSREAKVATRPVSMRQLGQDGYDTVEWVARQNWSNGKVGMWGLSALGRIQYQTAAERPPHLVCAVPVVAMFGHAYGQYFHGGVLKKDYVDSLGRIGFAPMKGLIEAHPTKDLLWRFLDRASSPSLIAIPMLLIGGWYDLYTDGVLKTFMDLKTSGGPRAREHTKAVIGPWHHTTMGQLKVAELEFPGAKGASGREAKRFLDYWLLDARDNGWDAEPAFRHFQMGENRWYSGNAWPPRPTQELVWHLHADRTLKCEAPAGDAGAHSFQYDPNDPSPTIGGMNLSPLELSVATPARVALLSHFLRAGPMDQRKRVESRADQVSYTTGTLTENVAVLGNASARLYVSSDRVCTDLAIRLCDVCPDGRSILVTDGIQRVRFTGEDGARPGGPELVTVRLCVTAITFLKGHRVRMIVSSSNYPRFDRYPNNGKERMSEGEPLVATNSIHHGPQRLSALVLPIIVGGTGEETQ